MSRKNAVRWGFIGLFAGVGAWLFITFVRLPFMEGVSGGFDVLLFAIPLGASAILLHWAYLLFEKQNRVFAEVFSLVVALLVAALLISLPVSRYVAESYQAWWEATDRHPLVGILGFPLGIAFLALPFVGGRLAYWGGRRLLLKMFGETSASRRMLQ